jgi:hypothetical protein
VNIEIPPNAEDLARSKANLAGFSDVGQYIVSLIFRDDWATEPPSAATSASEYERLVVEGLNSGSPSPMSGEDFERVRQRLRASHEELSP